MNGQVTLLMTNTSPELCRLCKEFLPGMGINVLTCERNGDEAFKMIVKESPDAVLLDVFMPGMDAFLVKRKYTGQFPDSSVIFYAIGTFQNDDLEKEIIDSGFSFYFLKPLDVSALAARILHATGAPAKPKLFPADSIEIVTADILRSMGMPAHIKGYRFLRDAIVLVVNEPEAMNSVTKYLYPRISQMNDSTSARVERAIRHAIEVTWERGDIETLNYYFGATVHSLRGKPTNSEFIAMLADHVTTVMKKRA